jgi:RNA polymerase sigma-70 factor (ECF subfamily)
MAGNKQLEDQTILDWIGKPETLDKGFRALVDKYQQKLYWHVRRMVLSHDDADDILQNTFIKVYRNIDQFEQKSSLYTWLYRIATNESLTFIERSKKFQYDFMEDQEEHPAISNLRSDPYFDGNEIQLRLQEALAGLPERQKQVFLLRYNDEMSYKDMSEVLQTSEGALKASYHHAVKKIEEYFKLKELI